MGDPCLSRLLTWVAGVSMILAAPRGDGERSSLASFAADAHFYRTDHEHGSEPSLKIWIDADAAPREVKELVFRAARRLSIDTILVANRRLRTPLGNSLVSAVWVDGGADMADQYIAAHAAPGDLVVTQDVPLAALLVPRQVAVLDPRGEEHTAETIGERLSVRDFMEQARIAGAVTGGPPAYDARAKQAFAAALDRVLTRLRRRSDGASTV